MGFFSRKKSLRDYAQTAEIYPAMEDGNYKAFIIKVSIENTVFSSALNAEGENGLGNFMMMIDNRISNNDFDDPHRLIERIYGSDSTLKRNYDAKRIVVSSNEQILFGWNDKDR
jgi:hypothetical protein